MESVARELKMLGDRRESLTKTDLDRAKSLMVQLKQKGMLNSEIAELSGWSESSVKGYTKGVGTKDPEPWRSAAAMFSEMLSKNLNFNDVRGALGLSKTINSLGASLNEVCGFMDRLVGKNISLNDVERALVLIEEIQAEETSLDKVCGFIDSLIEKNISLAQVAEAIELDAKLCKIGTLTCPPKIGPLEMRDSRRITTGGNSRENKKVFGGADISDSPGG